MKINAHHIYGLAFVALGALLSNQQYLRSMVSDHTFGLIMMGAGVGVAVFGFLKSNPSS